ncbi:hypothetical protein FB45DRAFT_1079122 [Roridomyces roridus]|uniref:F-box domain-containing protein n=1 Tax=Roridomyces roridus TaxID=1738132 RepID=A0AAD7CKY6_9AGAR|nr:hypothetical protein FB45DRAFT_1079122 [Roridomyces roridus]
MPCPFESILHTNAVPTPTERQHIHEVQAFVDPHSLASPARRLSDDLVREIFLASLPDTGNPAFNRNESPLLVAQISTSWRRIALSTPRLWSSMHIVVPHTTHLGRLTEQIISWLSRSGVAPLSISLVFSEAATPTLSGSLEQNAGTHVISLLLILVAESHRWLDIDFTVPDTAARHFNLSLTSDDIPLLKSLVFSDGLPGDRRLIGPDPTPVHPQFPFLATQSLRKLAIPIGCLDLRTPGAVLWHNLVHLAFEAGLSRGLTCATALNLLSQCHLLEYCALPLYRSRRDPAVEIAPFTLPYLAELRLALPFHAGEAHTRFFSVMSLPALHSLHCTGSGFQGNGVLLCEYFFPNDVSTLQHLNFGVDAFPSGLFFEIIAKMTALQTLCIRYHLRLEPRVQGSTSFVVGFPEILAHLSIPEADAGPFPYSA